MRRKAFKILASFLVFVVSYALFLAVWVKVRTYYGHPMNFLAAQLAAFSLNIDVEAVKKSATSKEKITMTKPIATTRGLADLVVDQTVDINNYTFNVPLTAALLVACLLFMRWPWYILIEGLLIIMSGHLLYVYSYLMLNFQKVLANLTGMKISWLREIFWEFAWAFADNLVIRFEPFLVVVIIWLLYGKRELE